MFHHHNSSFSSTGHPSSDLKCLFSSYLSNTSKYFQIRKKHNINHNYINQSSSFCIQRYYNPYCYCCFGLGDKNLQTSGMERDWPEGRGIFHNKAGGVQSYIIPRGWGQSYLFPLHKRGRGSYIIGQGYTVLYVSLVADFICFLCQGFICFLQGRGYPSEFI